MPKFLIIRLSSIGDIVLTSPVIRCLKKQVPNAEIHFLTRNTFKSVLENNPYIDKLWTTDGTLNDVIPQLKKEEFTEIIDLHHNIRTYKIKRALGLTSTAFSKLNIEKWLLVNLKINRMPSIHIVDRYLSTVKHLHVVNDGKGLDYFISVDENISIDKLPSTHRNGFIACVIGAKHATKIMPTEKIIAVLKTLQHPIVLLGGPDDKERGNNIATEIGSSIFNACGIYKLNESASLLQQSKLVITHDTGLMHIAAAFKKPIVSLWGNTVPEFGMTPYFPMNENHSIIMEVKNLSCRPCSKIGYNKCPKKHFNCMNQIKNNDIIIAVNKLIS